MQMEEQSPPSILQSGTPSGIKLKHKKMTLFWSVVHKAAAVNEWWGKISTKIGKNCFHCGPPLVELVEYMLYNYPLAQHVWRPTSFGNSLPIQGTLAHKSLVQCYNVFLIKHCAKHLDGSVAFCYFLEVDFPWIIWCQRNDGNIRQSSMAH